ncbi:D-alanyl-D-alanine carboxypeptidase [Streptomyces luteolifulvus]|uniref:D-alanyl-D-alanine carboxypeptidase n=1 Tax=Streptomyces luteolifulvus TaxID=2615112 RepID=A0A6H9V760_9ACTN|nr:serine hydrolase [Streptomyces luteolifulvus]KAB1149407.1 D-alanyl-D-alanine carboxypeptidase [Streptomyces luteolifulvus]MXM64990.1 D-alanyl-D-alanine carboxypeptidase [Streptomyces sp. HUCO-GS316]
MTTVIQGVRLRRTAAVVATTGAVLAGGVLSAPAHAATAPSVSAKGAFMLDNATGSTLYSKYADTKRPMASTTKVMTARVVLSTPDLNLDRKVTIKQAYRDYVTAKGASTADLKTGDKVTVRQLLHAMMLPSGCDAAMALADTFGTGTTVSARTKSFISKMNSKAVALNLTNTHFDSFDGISTQNTNYTTPRDLAKLARSAMKYSTFRGIVKKTKTVQYATTSTGGTRTYTWYNTNKLLGSYSGAIGVKTGTNTPAGPCLVFAATRGDKTVIGVLLNDQYRYTDAAKLMDYAFGTSTATTMQLRTLPAGAQRD